MSRIVLRPARREPIRWFGGRDQAPKGLGPALSRIAPPKKRFELRNDTGSPVTARLTVHDEDGRLLREALHPVAAGTTACIGTVRMEHGFFVLGLEAGEHRIDQEVLNWGTAGCFRFVMDDCLRLEGEGFDPLVPEGVPGVPL